jgi:murein DD-endopeptidase MepM/ murein hydrolase activator NlpD
MDALLWFGQHVAGPLALWLIANLPGWAWWVLLGLFGLSMIRRAPVLGLAGVLIGFRAVGAAARGSHGNPLRGLIVVVVACAAIGHALGMGDGGSADATAATSGGPFGGACQPVVTQGYGPTDLVGEPIVNGVRMHTGIDLACPAGTPVYAVSAGLAQVGFDRGFGNNVVIQAAAIFIRYAHLSSAAVPNGATVKAGDLLGYEGSTGFSTGPHLHFEVDMGAPSVQRSVDPRSFLTGCAPCVAR